MHVHCIRSNGLTIPVPFSWISKLLVCRYTQSYPIIVCLYMYCCWRSSYQEGRAKVPLTCISPPHLCACPKPESGFLTSHVMVFSLCSVSLVKMRGECSLCLILVDWIPSMFRLTLENTEGAIKMDNPEKLAT